MDRVPPGFNALVDRKVNAAADVIRASVLPIFRADSDAKPAFEGSGVLVRVDGLDLIVSAAHVFDEMRDGGVHLLLDGREKQALADPIRLTLGARPEHRFTDRLDIGFVRLSPEEVTAAGPENFVEVPPRALQSEMRWYLRYMVLGYVAKDQVRFDAERRYQMTQTYYSAPELRRGKYRSAGIDETANIGIDFNHRRIEGPTGKGGRPNLIGMSGGGIWEINPYEDYSVDNPPRLVGFLAGPAPKNKKALFGASTTALTELVRSMKPSTGNRRAWRVTDAEADKERR